MRATVIQLAPNSEPVTVSVLRVRAYIAAALGMGDVVLLGDGAAGLSLLDVDTLVRHRLPVVPLVGDNSAWGLERQSTRLLSGYDVAAGLADRTACDAIVTALGGAGETVSRPDRIGSALRRAFDSGVPYLVNVLLDPEVGYPRHTFGL